eukprot:COSAG06_NODE_21886_length_742_cov_0.636081_1_plen_167_part_00
MDASGAATACPLLAHRSLGLSAPWVGATLLPVRVLRVYVCCARTFVCLQRDRDQMEAALAFDREALANATGAEPEPEPEPEQPPTGLPVGGVVSSCKPKIYIVKPALGLQGIGIELTTAPDKTAMAIENGKGVVQVGLVPPAAPSAAAGCAASALRGIPAVVTFCC